MTPPTRSPRPLDRPTEPPKTPTQRAVLGLAAVACWLQAVVGALLLPGMLGWGWALGGLLIGAALVLEASA
ncbi:MAG: hypothetical protein ACTHMS_23560 [Jatrophihabitans sp.]|uniref:hypothetical protein n=1 Tax=Jatrophihabitans sp. TaxID=1932789 RepID=UPI003F7DF73C